MSSHSRFRSAFTLIELLVVIAIIAILAAILFPVFGRVRENARRSSCQANLKQIALGIAQYKQDFDERYPGEGSADPTNATTIAAVSGWAYVIQPYLKSEQIFQCPSDRLSPPDFPTLQARASNNGFSDYWYNRQFGATGGGGILDAAVASPANTVLNGDSGGTGASSDSRFNAGGPSDVGANRHFEGANHSFADGHVKWLKQGKVLDSLSGTTSLCTGGTAVNIPTGGNATFCTS